MAEDTLSESSNRFGLLPVCGAPTRATPEMAAESYSFRARRERTPDLGWLQYLHKTFSTPRATDCPMAAGIASH